MFTGASQLLRCAPRMLIAAHEANRGAGGARSAYTILRDVWWQRSWRSHVGSLAATLASQDSPSPGSRGCWPTLARASRRQGSSRGAVARPCGVGRPAIGALPSRSLSRGCVLRSGAARASPGDLLFATTFSAVSWPYWRTHHAEVATTFGWFR